MAPPHRQIPPREWEHHKENIVRLWLDDNLPIEGTKAKTRSVMQVMRDEHNFEATRDQYKSKFEDWGVFKNLKKYDWEVVLPIYLELKTRGLSPRVIAGHRLLGEKTIRKARRQYLGKDDGLNRELNAEPRPFSYQAQRWRIEILENEKYIEYRHSTVSFHPVKDGAITDPMHSGSRDDGIDTTNPPPQVDAARAANGIQAGELIGPSDISQCLPNQNTGVPGYGTTPSLPFPASEITTSQSSGFRLSDIFANEARGAMSMLRSMRVLQLDVSVNALGISARGLISRYQQSSSVTNRETAADSDKPRLEDRAVSSGIGTAQENDIRYPMKYKVGIICALPKEIRAVRAVFDKDHGKPGPLLSGDSNHYSLGQIGSHMVVVACLPAGEIGNNPAAEVASNLKRSFPNVRFCLFIGIGGGVPSLGHDIRLGDVVVSMPTETYSGVIQYDRGTAHGKDIFQRKGALPPPPRFLMTAISSLVSDPRFPANPLEPHLEHILKGIPDRVRSQYQYPGYEHDVLFKKSCSKCKAGKHCDRRKMHEKDRDPRRSNAPQIHYGLIASGNMVIRDSQLRDRWASEYEVLCFEMEAAGVMNTLPCLIIRGICDYADEYKNKSWQEYAAATAAAYGKLLLGEVSPSSYDSSDAEARNQKCEDTSRPRALRSLEGSVGVSTLEWLAFTKSGLLVSLCLVLSFPFLHQYLRLHREVTVTHQELAPIVIA
ncbi:unnamed protein product [Clonostachys rosea]|uniref:Nucleoside phosphorylase domain-containing protein n=1 Tax=Bionectria ochroleuca TaxID=29856 RepID=A0ABY6UKU0_BIOOC|nr:unnamed protein product [Clonostachys rosea]